MCRRIFLFTRQNTSGLCPGDEWRGNKLFRSRSEAERRNTSGLCPGVVYSHRATNPHWRWKLLKSFDFLIFALLVRFLNVISIYLSAYQKQRRLQRKKRGDPAFFDRQPNYCSVVTPSKCSSSAAASSLAA